MCRRLIMLIWLVWITCSVGRVSTCPAGCVCNPAKATAFCQHLDDFPRTFDPDTTNVTIRDSFFTSLDRNDLVGIPLLTLLDITNGSIAHINEDTFENSALLNTLRIRHCPLSFISEGTFATLVKLTELDLTNDTISALNRISFAGLSGLDTLRLEGNDIEDIGNGTFLDLGTLTRLGLKRNRLDTINHETFEGLDKLQLLGLGYNNITALGDGTFAALSMLQRLYLDNNFITSLPDGAFNGLSSLSVLDLSYNNLAEVPSIALSNLTQLTDLSLDGNAMTNIPTKAFADLTNLERIQLDGMSSLEAIGSKAFVNLKSLRRLSIENNSMLTSLDQHAIPSNEAMNLKYLFLSNNGFQSLNESVFSDKPGLELATVEGNPFDCTCALKWMPGFMHKEDTYQWVKDWQSGHRAPDCVSPSHLSGRLIYELFENDLTCEVPKVVHVEQDTAYVSLDDTASFQALLDGGLPAIEWTSPSGETFLPGDTVHTPEGTLEANRTVMSNHSVLATLTITNLASESFGNYLLMGYNAGGNVSVTFHLKLLSTSNTGLTGGDWATIFVCVAVGIVLVVLLLLWYTRSRKAEVSENSGSGYEQFGGPYILGTLQKNTFG